MPKTYSIADTIRLQTGMSLRELADIWQVSPATLTLSLQGKRPRPAGLTECLAVQERAFDVERFDRDIKGIEAFVAAVEARKADLN